MDQKGFAQVAFVVCLLAVASAIYFLLTPGKDEEAATLGIVAAFAFFAALFYGVLAWLHDRKHRRP